MTTEGALATPQNFEEKTKSRIFGPDVVGNQAKKSNRGSRSKSYNAKSAKYPRYRRKGIRSWIGKETDVLWFEIDFSIDKAGRGSDFFSDGSCNYHFYRLAAREDSYWLCKTLGMISEDV